MTKEMTLLRTVFEATKEGVIDWSDETEEWVGRYRDIDLKIETMYPDDSDGFPTGADVLEFTMATLTLRYYAGTLGMSICRSIINAIDPIYDEWTDGFIVKERTLLKSIDMVLKPA